MSWLDISNDLTEEGQKELRVGQVLMFEFEGSPLHLRIMRKYKDKVWAKEVKLLTIDEFKIEGERRKKLAK